MTANLTRYGYESTTLQPAIIELVPCADRILDLGGGRGGNGAMVKGLARACFACTADPSEEAIRQAVPGIDQPPSAMLQALENLRNCFRSIVPLT